LAKNSVTYFMDGPQARGKRKTRKVCEKHVHFPKSGGKFKKVGGNNKFPEIVGKCGVLAKIRENLKFLFADETYIFWEKSKEFSSESEKF